MYKTHYFISLEKEFYFHKIGLIEHLIYINILLLLITTQNLIQLLSYK